VTWTIPERMTPLWRPEYHRNRHASGDLLSRSSGNCGIHVVSSAIGKAISYLSERGDREVWQDVQMVGICVSSLIWTNGIKLDSRFERHGREEIMGEIKEYGCNSIDHEATMCTYRTVGGIWPSWHNSMHERPYL
jgi:hypothetical protein